MLLLGIAAYIVLQLAVGAYVARTIRTEDDYLLAGRRLGPALATASMFATWFGAESCIGAAGRVHDEGVTAATVEPFAYALCLVLLGTFYAAALWRARITTLADLFRVRYGAATEKVAAVLLIPTSLLWAAAQIRAFGQVLTSGGLPLEVGVLVAAAVVIFYTALGGMLADVVTDVIQGVAVVVGLLVVCVAAVSHLGGLHAAVAVATAPRPAAPVPLGFLTTAEAWAIPVLGSLVAQEAVSRSLAARSVRVAQTAAIAGGSLYLLVGLLPVFLGLVGPRLIPGLDDGERLLPELSIRFLPLFGQVLFAGALVSAILSTVDTTLLVAGSVVSRNLLPAASAARAGERRVGAARLSVIACGVVAAVIAVRSEGVLALVEEASGFGSAAILVLVTFGLFTRTGAGCAAVVAMLASLAAWVLGRYVLAWPLPYLTSVGAALLGFGLGAGFDRWSRGQGTKMLDPTVARPSSA